MSAVHATADPGGKAPVSGAGRKAPIDAEVRAAPVGGGAQSTSADCARPVPLARRQSNNNRLLSMLIADGLDECKAAIAERYLFLGVAVPTRTLGTSLCGKSLPLNRSGSPRVTARA